MIQLHVILYTVDNIANGLHITYTNSTSHFLILSTGNKSDTYTNIAFSANSDYNSRRYFPMLLKFSLLQYVLTSYPSTCKNVYTVK